MLDTNNLPELGNRLMDLEKALKKFQLACSENISQYSKRWRRHYRIQRLLRHRDGKNFLSQTKGYRLETNQYSIAHATCSKVTNLSIKPASQNRHKHKHKQKQKQKLNMKTNHEFSSGTYEDKTTRIFLCFAFCAALGLSLDYDLMLMLMLMTILMSQAWPHSFVFPFVLPLCLCLCLCH